MTRIVFSPLFSSSPAASHGATYPTLALVLVTVIGGSHALSFSPENGTITLKTEPIDKQVKITITDEGPGIPESNLETIFKRFYSQRPSGETYGQHSGLGLSICKQIITALNGRITAENAQPIGARFVITLPML